MKPLFEEHELPVADLQKLGLYKDGKSSLSADDVDALLAGRRTDLISIQNLRTDAFHIQQLDSKLSLKRYADGSVSLNLHPINKEAVAPGLLDKKDVEQLISGELTNIAKQVPLGNGKKRTLIIEYDPQTREFIGYDPAHVKVPEKVNGQQLSPEDRHRYRIGDMLELKDGTRLQHRASERKGVLSDRQGLILSVLLDGGISYLLITGIRNLLNNNEVQKDHYTQGYQHALKEMKDNKRNGGEIKLEQVSENKQKNDYSRGYGRGASR